MSELGVEKIGDAVEFAIKHFANWDVLEEERKDNRILVDVTDIFEFLKEREKLKKTSSTWPTQDVFVSEEAAELIIELAKMQKTICKSRRNKASLDDIAAEAIDVLTTVITLLYEYGYSISDVCHKIEEKLERATNRYLDHNET